MAYWIIVSSDDKADKKVTGVQKWLTRKEDGFWGVPDSSSQQSIVSGDKAFFYIASPKMVLVGPVTVLSGIHELTEAEKGVLWKESVAFSANQGFFFRIEDNCCGACEVKPLVDEDKLTFVQDKNNWGLSFHHSLFGIEQKDYETILNEIDTRAVDAPYLFQDTVQS